MLRLTLIITFGLVRIGLSQELTGQVFLLAEDFREDKCEAVADCDCCGTELFFLSNTKFGFVFWHCPFYWDPIQLQIIPEK